MPGFGAPAVMHLLEDGLSVRQTAHSTWKVSGSWFLVSSISLGSWYVIGTDDSRESTFPMFWYNKSELLRESVFELKAVTAGRKANFRIVTLNVATEQNELNWDK